MVSMCVSQADDQVRQQPPCQGVRHSRCGVTNGEPVCLPTIRLHSLSQATPTTRDSKGVLKAAERFHSPSGTKNASRLPRPSRMEPPSSTPAPFALFFDMPLCPRLFSISVWCVHVRVQRACVICVRAGCVVR